MKSKKILAFKWFVLLVGGLILGASVVSTSARAFGEQTWIVNLVSKRQFLRWNGSIMETVELARFYSNNQFASIWVDKLGRRNQVASSLRNILLAADRHGLTPTDYWTPELESLFNDYDDRTWITFEIAASEAYLRYAKDLSIGKVDPSLLEFDVKFARRKFDSYEALVKATQAPTPREFYAALDALAPQHAQYNLLAVALARIKNTQVWVEIGSGGRTLKQGVKDANVLALRDRLRVLGYDNEGTDVYDQALADVVKRFQADNKLVSDGSIGPTSKAWDVLNVKKDDRLDSIELSMERLRWLPVKLEERNIIVNIASTELILNDPDYPMNFKVVAGRPFKRTPIMRDQIYKIELNPTWTVPFRIAVDDKLKHQQKDPDYFTKMKIRVYDSRTYKELNPNDIDWSTISEKNFWYTLVQDPGIDNSLGVIKFHLELNRDDIYMHDTNERYLFPELDRNRSSGCVRLEKPFELADYLLKDDTTWTPEAVRAAVATETNSDVQRKLEIPLAKKLPVYLVYLTSTVSDQGGLKWFPDIYEQDARLRRLFDSVGRIRLMSDFEKASLPISGWGELKVTGEASSTQIFSKVRAVRCVINQKASCENSFEFDLNTPKQVPEGSYIIGFENSVNAGFVQVVEGKTTELKLSRLNFPASLATATNLRVYRDLRSETEKKKLYDEIFYNESLLFEQASYGFGDFYVRAKNQTRALPFFNFALCTKIRAEGDDSDDYSLRAKALCGAWNAATSSPEIATILNQSPAGRSDQEVDSEMAVLNKLDDVGDLVPVRLLRLLVAPVSPSNTGYLLVFPGQYRVSKPGQAATVSLQAI